ncbi:hypothetical protein ScPMuIL_013481 [Solemya velum]
MQLPLFIRGQLGLTILVTVTVAVVVLRVSHGQPMASQKDVSTKLNRRRKGRPTEFITDDGSLTRETWLHRKTDNVYFPVFLNSSVGVLNHVAFAQKQPSLSPWEWRRALHGINETSKTRTRLRHGKFRSMKTKPRYESAPLSPCTSISSWVIIKNATRLLGGTVEVVETFDVGPGRITQYFFVNECLRDEGSCFGIDRRAFRSECANEKIWVKARIINKGGIEDWAHIAINGACSCKLFRKKKRPYKSHLEH